MGSRGPIGKSPQLRALEGNPGKRPIRVGRTPSGFKPIGPPPDWIDDGAKAEWRRAARSAWYILTSLDRAIFTMYCETWSRIEALEADLEKNGLTQTTPRGRIVPRPEVRICNAEWHLLLVALRELGFTPAARARIGIEPPQDPKRDSFAERFFT